MTEVIPQSACNKVVRLNGNQGRTVGQKTNVTKRWVGRRAAQVFTKIIYLNRIFQILKNLPRTSIFQVLNTRFFMSL